MLTEEEENQVYRVFHEMEYFCKLFIQYTTLIKQI